MFLFLFLVAVSPEVAVLTMCVCVCVCACVCVCVCVCVGLFHIAVFTLVAVVKCFAESVLVSESVCQSLVTSSRNVFVTLASMFMLMTM